VAFKPAKRLPKTCELPNTFLLERSRRGAAPCCASAIGVCAGGAACPAGGVCPDGRACVPGSPPPLADVVVMIADDLGECHHGQMSNLSGPYGPTMRRANCCVDDWWPEPASIGTICSGAARPI
jgi:hypothetical protein